MSKEKQDLWQEYNFFDVIEVLDFRGRTPKKLNLDWGGDIPALSANNVKMGKIDYSLTTNFGSEELYSKWMTKGDLEIGDLVLTTEAPAGNVVVINDNKKYILSQRVIGLKPDKRVIDSNYLMYFFMSNYFKNYLQGYGTGTTVTGISQKNLEFLKIIAPPLEEQQKIAEILSSVDATIEKTEQVIAKTEEVKKGLMQQLLTKGISHTEFKQTELGEIPVQWQVKKLADLGEALIGLTYSPDNITDESGTLVLRSSNIRGNRLSFDDNVYVDLDIPKRCVVQKDDILICVRNGSKALIGKSALIDNETVGCSFGAFMSVYRSKYNRYIFQLFNTELFKKQIYSNLGATINQITSANLKSFKFPIPPKEEQDKIVEILESYDSRVKIEEDKIKNLNLIKQGLMQQLLTGKTRVKVD